MSDLTLQTSAIRPVKGKRRAPSQIELDGDVAIPDEDFRQQYLNGATHRTGTKYDKEGFQRNEDAAGRRVQKMVDRAHSTPQPGADEAARASVMCHARKQAKSPFHRGLPEESADW
jgi:hypothetical protein